MQEKKMKDSEKQYFQITSLEKGLKVLELLAEKESLTVAKVAEHLGFNRTGSHRYLATLRNLGYVEQDTESSYFLTFKVLKLAMRFLSRFEIRGTSRPHLEELAHLFNETVNLGFWDGKAIRILDKIDSHNVLRTDSAIGTLMPAHCTSLGKSILAFLPLEELKAFLDTDSFDAFSSNTITSRERIKEELRKTRERGFAMDNEEWLEGIRCVAAPIFDYTGRPTYSISIAGPSLRMTSKVVNDIQKKVRQTCHQLSLQLGCPAGGDAGRGDRVRDRSEHGDKS